MVLGGVLILLGSGSSSLPFPTLKPLLSLLRLLISRRGGVLIEIVC
jgi:hypothetical protein